MYGAAGLFCFGIALAAGLPIAHHDRATWGSFFLLALVPTVLGHTSLNHALRHLDVGWVSSATLAEPPLAGLVAALAWNEWPKAGAVFGYAVISAAVLLLVWDATPRGAGHGGPAAELSGAD